MNIELRKTLWAAADKLRSSMDAAEYKHLVLGLIFVKYISDAFDELLNGLRVALADPESELYLDDPVVRADAEEDRDYYTAANVFWVPEQARWENLRAHAKQANIGRRIDAALDAIEADNPRLKGILDKRFGRAQILFDLRYVAFAHDGDCGLACRAAGRRTVGRTVRHLILRRPIFATDANAVDDFETGRRRAGTHRLHVTIRLLEVEVHLIRIGQAEHGRN